MQRLLWHRCALLLASCMLCTAALADGPDPYVEPMASYPAQQEVEAAALPAQWVSTTPGGGGAFNSPVVTTPSGYWAVGSDLSGVYISTNGGASWRVIGAASNLTVTHIAALSAHPAGKLIVGTDDGVFVAREDGSGMRKTYADGYISALVVSADPNVLYAARHPEYNALNPGLLRSNNGGDSWELVSQDLPSGLRVVGLRAHPVDPDAVLVLSGKGRFATGPAQAWLSIDSGQTFGQMAAELGDIMDVVYGTNPENLNGMYLTTYRNQNTGYLYASEDAGDNWRQVSGHTGVILVDGTAPQRIRLLEVPVQHADESWEGNTMLWESVTGGTWSSTKPETTLTPAWSRGYLTWGMGAGFQGDVQTFGMDPGRPNTVLWTDAQFVYASTNGGKSWAVVVSNKVGTAGWRSRGIDNAVPAVIAPSPADARIVYAGYFDMGLWRSDDGGSSWISLNDVRYSGAWSTAVGGNTLTVLPDPTRAGVVWAQLGGNAEEPMYLVKSSNRGATWSRVTTGLPATMYKLQGLSVDPISSSTARKLYLITNGAIYRSTTDGNSWSKVYDCASCLFTTVINGTVYAGGGGGLWRSATGAVGSWSRVTGLPTAGWTPDITPRDWGYVGIMDLAAAKDGRLWAAVFGRGFYRSSSSSGTVWTLFRSDAFARTVSVDPATGLIFTGSSSAYMAGGYDPRSRGVMTFDGTSWRSLNAGLAWPFATMVRVVKGVRWVISPGQGVLKWQ